LSPNHVQVDVLVSANAALSNPDVSAISGFLFATAPAGFQITAPVAGLPAAYPVLFNAWPGLTGAYAGAIASLYGSNMSTTGNTPQISIGGLPATILYASPSQINLQIPAGLTPGPATLLLSNGVLNSYPITVNIDTPPALIAGIQNGTGAYIYAANAAHLGDVLIVTLINFAPVGTNISNSQVQMTLAGVSHNAFHVTEVGAYYQVYFQLAPTDPVGQAETLIVYLNGRSSDIATIPVANPDGTYSPEPVSGSN
jgi:uncharacterized protein (TIGR03437 family)